MASSFQWGFQQIWLKGEKQELLVLAQELQKVYLTDAGERLINSLGLLRVRYLIEAQQDWHFNPDKPETIGIGADKEHYQEELYKILSHIYQFHDESGPIPAVAEFLDQKREEAVIEIQHPNHAFLTIKGSERKVARLMSVLEEIEQNMLGKNLFNNIKECGNSLLIYDDKSSLSGGGYAGPVKTSSRIFTPGQGESAFIRFRFDQPLTGSHIVQAKPGVIPFTYIDNLFHELVHAKHLMCGTFSPRAAETQAIIEENEFRRSRPETEHLPERDYSKYEEGQQIWFGLFMKKN